MLGNYNTNTYYIPNTYKCVKSRLTYNYCKKFVHRFPVEYVRYLLSIIFIPANVTIFSE
jgi:hypothetical protein